MIIAVTLIILCVSTISRCDLCNKTPRGLLRFTELDKSTKMSSFLFKKMTIDAHLFVSETTIYAVKVIRYKSKCTADWGSGQYASCPGVTESISISDSEAIDSGEKRRCYVGIECKMDGDCYGKESELCDQDSTRNITIQPRDLAFTSGHWTKAIHDTCLQTWGCIANNYKSPVFLKENNASPVPFVIAEGKEMLLSFSESNCMLGKSGVKYCVKVIPQPRTFSIGVNCIQTKSDMLCIPTVAQNSKVKGIVIRLNSKGIGIHKEFFFDAGQTFYLDRNSVSASDEQAIRKGDAVAMETILELLNAIKFEQAQGIFNALSIERSLMKVKEIVRKLIIEASKQNPMFLSEIIGSSVQTTWINPDHALIQNCVKIPSWRSKESCVSRFEYNGISWTEKQDGKKCLKINLNVTDLKLFDEVFLDEDMVTNIDFIEATQEKDEMEIRRNVEQPQQVDDKVTYQGRSGFFYEITACWESISGGFYKIGSFFSWFLMIKLLLSR